MTAVDETLTRLLAAVRASPDDWDARRVLGDRLEELGDDCGANGMRWQAKQRKRPDGPDRNFPEWSWANSVNSNFSVWNQGFGHAALPDEVWHALGPPVRPAHAQSNWKLCGDFDEAEAMLARALWSLGIVVRGDE